MTEFNGSLYEGRVSLPGGQFRMGASGPETWTADAEGPVRTVELKPFAIDVHAVTNLDFKGFIEATGYVTDAERFGWTFLLAC